MEQVLQIILTNGLPIPLNSTEIYYVVYLLVEYSVVKLMRNEIMYKQTFAFQILVEIGL